MTSKTHSTEKRTVKLNIHNASVMDPLRNFLDGKTCILVTHQLQYVKAAKLICLLESGTLQAMGSYDEITESGSHFLQFLSKDKIKITEANVKFDKTFETLDTPHDKKENNDETRDTKHDDKQPLIIREVCQKGSVTMGTYIGYFKSANSNILLAILFCLVIIASSVDLLGRLVLGKWSRAAIILEKNWQIMANNESFTEEVKYGNNFYIMEYGLILAMFSSGIIAYSVLFKYIAAASSRKMHDNMFAKVLRSKMIFFDTNPVGRVLNRFSKDIGLVDELLPDTMEIYINGGATCVSLIVIVCISNPIAIVGAGPVLIVFYMLRKYFLNTSRSVQRLEAVARSPIFGQLSSSLNGLTTIRAFKAEEMLNSEFVRIQNVHSSSWFASLALGRWFAVSLDWTMGGLLVLCVYSLLGLRDSTTAVDAALVLTSFIEITFRAQFVMRQSVLLEQQMTSVERIFEYGQLDSEAPLDTNLHNDKLECDSQGAIEFRNVWLKYAKTKNYILKDMSFVIDYNEKIGVVGRTGAGKSSLITALFRIVEPEGTILINGVPTKHLGLHDVRQRMSIIPQEPMMFIGTLRKNLDPFEEYDDDKIWMALNQVKMDTAACIVKGGLNTQICEGGTNLSAGESQLLCFARAILRRNKIIILDEATANVDLRTDAMIQEKIRTCFEHSTIITIAHRLNTVMDSDRIMVLSDGKITEFAPPHELLQNEESMLSQMVNQTGNMSSLEMKRIAEKSYNDRHMSR